MNKFDVGAQVTRALLVGLALMAGCIDGSDDAIEEVAGEETTSTEHALASDPAGPDIAAILAAAGVPVDGEPNDLEEVHAEALSTVGVGDLNIGTGDTAFGQDVLGQPISDTTTVFEDVYPSTDAVVQETAEGVRLISVIRDAAAPTEFVYTFGDVTLTRNEATGAIEISRDGVNQGFIDLAWAVDAAGTEVPTEYEIQGSTLVQIVNHTGAQYPVVADPNVKRNCGIITCTWYFTKWYTKHVLKESTAPVLGSTIMCGALINPPVVAVCAAYVFAHGAFAVLKINEAAAANKCFTAAYTALGGSFHIGTSNDRRYCANR